jgi:hypothetical protein
MCSLAPDCGIDRAKLTTVADHALSINDRLGLAKGMNDYCCGRYEQALAVLPPSGDHFTKPLTLLFRAMAQYRLGHAEQARQLLAQGVLAIEEKGVQTIEGPPLAEHLPDRWIVWCTIEVVRREAAALIVEPADNPTLEKQAKPNPETE